MAQFNANNKVFRSLLLSIAVTTFITLLFFLAHSERVTGSLSQLKLGNFASSQCSPPADTDLTRISTSITVTGTAGSTPSATPVRSILPAKQGNPDLLQVVPSYVKAIFDPNDNAFQRLDCPPTASISRRYEYLRISPTAPSRRRYFFALDLYQIADILPQLMGSLIQVILFLGPHNCVLSIVEGRSTDGTYEILRSLAPQLEELGVPYFLQMSGLSPQRANPERIVLLAELRNLALRDIYEHPDAYAPDATIIFSNDVYTCAEDILEIVHQQYFQKAHMTCGMDWANSSNPEQPRLYDTWVARSMTGDTFYKDMFDWDGGFFPDHAPSLARWSKWLPVQVFSCWNGVVAITAKPFMDGTLRFRGVEGAAREKKDEECYQGEPNHLTKDLWYLGYNRIATLPTITAAYNYWDARSTRELRGSVTRHALLLNGTAEEKISWEKDPPEKFHCIPAERDPEWVPWDQGCAAIYGKRRPAQEIP
ncbi:glycosyltransferase family 69 protein [Karstenula rhodostoma CBS 690.94]|uniref:Glycosyltransferase family 69 protein n=1 Tax=Karstenula rhodostoma CBS 690.94 TaxID=1392251 RepID=A0A9P4PFN2_9PLEO|nr:glycosyltransferase family 69 protein [Karstenula rhodostoma CBS 690.94]